MKSVMNCWIITMPVCVSDCYHDSLGVSLAEERLRKFGQEGGYLTRQSDVNQLLRKERSFTKWRPTTMESFSNKLTMRLPLHCSRGTDPVQSWVRASCSSLWRCRSVSCWKEIFPMQSLQLLKRGLDKSAESSTGSLCKKCPNCQKFFKVSSFQRHTRQCQQSNLTLVKHHCGIDDCKFSTRR